MLVRVSIGSLAAMKKGFLRASAKPGIAYVMQYSPHGCSATCAFCTQSVTSSSSKEFLSRVPWPVIDIENLLQMLEKSNFSRICLQSVIKKDFIEEALELTSKVSSIRKKVSVSITPIPVRYLRYFAREGADYLGVGLDASSEEVSHRVLKPYPWKLYWRFIEEGVKVFGERHVVTHIIVGLGESSKDLLGTVEKLYELGSEVSLFAFTPMRGTLMDDYRMPSMREYRFAQVATYLIFQGYKWREFTLFRNGKPYIRPEFLDEVLNKPAAFITRGCPGCNRPFYTERPGKELYNFPNKEAFVKWKSKVREEIDSLRS